MPARVRSGELARVHTHRPCSTGGERVRGFPRAICETWATVMALHEARASAGGATTWGRAAAVGLLAVLVLVLLFFYVPHWILTKLPSPAREWRVWMATVWVILALAASSWVGWRTSGPSRQGP